MNKELARLVGGSFLMSKTFKISLNRLFNSRERSRWLGEQQLV